MNDFWIVVISIISWEVFKRVVFVAHAKYQSSKQVAQEPPLTEDEKNAILAKKENGPVFAGQRVFVINIETGKVDGVFEDRYRSSKELDPEKFKQYQAESGIHALEKFKRWKEAQALNN